MLRVLGAWLDLFHSRLLSLFSCLLLHGFFFFRLPDLSIGHQSGYVSLDLLGSLVDLGREGQLFRLVSLAEFRAFLGGLSSLFLGFFRFELFDDLAGLVRQRRVVSVIAVGPLFYDDLLAILMASHFEVTLVLDELG